MTVPKTFETEARDIGTRKRRAASIRAAAAEREPSTVSATATAVEQVLGNDPIVSLPEPFPMDFPFMAMQQHIDQMEKAAVAQYAYMREMLGTVEKHWPRRAGTPGTTLIASDDDAAAAVSEAVGDSIVCSDYSNHRSSHMLKNGMWVCTLCGTKPEVPEGQWQCPEHERGVLRKSSRSGKSYWACPVADCVEVGPRQ